MENEPVKIYMGRRSVCAGDDVNVQNLIFRKAYSIMTFI